MPESVIKSVSLMSTGPAKGHVDKATGKPIFIDPTTLDQLMRELGKGLALKVRADHGSGVMQTIGYVDNPACDGVRIRGDLHFYENAPDVALLMEIAEKNPGHLGLSMEFVGEDEETPDVVMARCRDGGLIAVAMVSDPAANKSLFSALLPATKHLSANSMADETEDKKTAGALSEMTAKFSQLQSDYAALQTKLTALEAGQQPADQNKNFSAEQVETIAKKAGEYSAQETVKAFAAKFGDVFVPKGGEHTPPKPVETDPVKLFESKVVELLPEFKGDKNNARVAAMKRFTAEYAATRLVAPKK